MMKSRPSAIKLRLSRLVRCLIGIGCIKLGIMAFALLDLPMPAWEKNSEVVEKQIISTPDITQPSQAQLITGKDLPIEVESVPQGGHAAELASAARPRNPNPWGSNILPAPMLDSGPIKEQQTPAFSPDLPTPPPLGAPLAKAGIILPSRKPVEPQLENEDSIWNVLDIKSLPIPGLGSAQAAHAAALDMPVPATPGAPSPFTPAEQLAGQNQSPIVLPGAPPLPTNITGGQQGAVSGQYAPPPPVSTGNEAPAPIINQPPSPLDPNVKNQELVRQQHDMLMLRQQMDQRLKDLQSAEDKMKDIIREAKDIEDKKVRSLIQMYSNMKPRMAAQAMEKMDERIAVRILSGMPAKQSGEILTYTNPVKTAKFTEMISRLRLLD